MKKNKHANSPSGLGILHSSLSRPKRSQFNFTWLFAIIAGAAIIALAIYGASRLGETERYKQDTQIAQEISILTEPLQAGFAEGSFAKISFNQETRINNNCFSEGFGKNELSVSTKSGIGEEWQRGGGASSIYNKYIFSSFEEGKEFYVFSKPFEFGFEVADLIFLSSKNYCFDELPEAIEDDILGFNADSISVGNCSEQDTKVCFNSFDCEIVVIGTCSQNCDSVFDEGYVMKNSEKMYFVGNLLYGAIFSDKHVYECNVERLSNRASKIAQVFADKANLMEARGCGSNLRSNLLSFSTQIRNAVASDLSYLRSAAKELERINSEERCGVW